MNTVNTEANKQRNENEANNNEKNSTEVTNRKTDDNFMNEDCSFLTLPDEYNVSISKCHIIIEINHCDVAFLNNTFKQLCFTLI